MSPNKSIILLGAHPLNKGFIKYAKDRNYDLIVIDWSERGNLFPGCKFILSDIKSCSLLELLDPDLNLAFAYTSSDVASVNVSKINKNFGLGFSDPDAINSVVKKSSLQAIWRDCGLLTRTTYIFSKLFYPTPHDFEFQKFLLKNGIVIKPSDQASSRDVFIFENPGDYEIKKNVLYKLLQKYDSDILIEQYIDGVEYSIEMIVDKNGNVDVWPIGQKFKSQFNSNKSVSVKVVYNPPLDKELSSRIMNFSRRCAEASGIRNSLLHLEVILSDNGEIHPIEMGCRSTGFVGSDLLDIVSNVGYLDTFYSVLRGNDLCGCNVRANDMTSVYFFYDFPRDFSPNIGSDDSNFWLSSEFKTHYFSSDFSKNMSHIDDSNKIFYRILSIPKSSYSADMLLRVERDLLEYLA